MVMMSVSKTETETVFEPKPIKQISKLKQSESSEDEVILRRKVSFTLGDGNSRESNSQKINNMKEIASYIARNHGTWSLTDEDVRCKSFIHRNLKHSISESKSEPEDNFTRPVSLPVVIASTFRRDSYIRQSWNNLWKRGKDKSLRKKSKSVDEKDTNNNASENTEDDLPSYKKGHQRNSSGSSSTSSSAR